MKQDYDDDGRSVADMSGVGKPSLLSGLAGPSGAPGGQGSGGDASRGRHGRGDDAFSRWQEHVDLDGAEKRAAIRGMLKAGLLIGLIYLAVFAAVIALLLWLWGVL